MFCMDSVYKAQKEALRSMPPEGFFDKNKTIINGFLSIWQKKACYFQNEKDLLELTQKNNTILQQNAKDMLEIANRNYKWETIANQYSIYY